MAEMSKLIPHITRVPNGKTDLFIYLIYSFLYIYIIFFLNKPNYLPKDPTAQMAI